MAKKNKKIVDDGLIYIPIDTPDTEWCVAKILDLNKRLSKLENKGFPIKSKEHLLAEVMWIRKEMKDLLKSVDEIIGMFEN